MKIDSMKYDPIDYYNNILKGSFNDNCIKYIDNYIKEANIDVTANNQTVKQIRTTEKKLSKLEKILSRFRIFKILLIILMVIGIILSLLGLLPLFSKEKLATPTLIMAIVGPILTVVSLLIYFLYLRKKIKHHSKIWNNLDATLGKLKKEGNNQLMSLLSKFNFKDFSKILNMTTSMFQVDDELKPEKLAILIKGYEFNEEFTENESITQVISGSIDSNPFVRIKLIDKKMYDHIYTGTRTITYTETYRDSDGDLKTRTRSDTLVAHVTAPAPRYSKESYLIYGNNAADKLSFVRSPSGISKEDDEKDIDKFVKKKSKRIEKLSEKAVKKGQNFQALANEEFESLFGAINRNNETQYRLLFTPLAQQNMVELITSKEPYGDDFSFFKKNKINIISSIHGRSIFEYDENVFNNYYSLENLKIDFIKYMKSLFSSLYFELAPLLSIPLYQMTEAGEFSIDENRNVSDYEAEAYLNNINEKRFIHEEADTPQILKVHFDKKVNDTDIFNVSSHSFKKIPQVSYVNVTANNGRTYSVAVNWIHYEPLTKLSKLGIKDCSAKDHLENSKKEFLFNRNASIEKLTRNKNFIGFYLDKDYNYSDEDEQNVTNYLNEELKYF